MNYLKHNASSRTKPLFNTARCLMASFAFVLALAVPRTLCAQDGALSPENVNEPRYSVRAFEFAYAIQHPRHPAVDDMKQITVQLGRTEHGFVAPSPDVELVMLRLDWRAELEIPKFSPAAIREVLNAVLGYFQDRDFIGVLIAPDPRDITIDGRDVRPTDRTALRLLITTGIVGEVRTIASGDRVWDDSLPAFDPDAPPEVTAADQSKPRQQTVGSTRTSKRISEWTADIPASARVNHPKHTRIRDHSPLRPSEEGQSDEERSDLIRKNDIDRYVFWLARHPGRRVDTSLGPSQTPGMAAVDYHVIENRPFVMYLQLSNTGTSSTSLWRQRFGFFHTQLTNNDDILSVDFTTASFDKYNALQASYEAPFPKNERIRWRVNGTWSEYTAADVGQFGSNFSGESFGVGGQIVANIYQYRSFFIDLIGGIRWADHEVTSPFVGTGKGDFLLPEFGIQMEQRTDISDSRAALTFDGNVLNVDAADLNRLGRTLPDENWIAMDWAAHHSVYLEPLLNRAAWEDPTTPESSTLAHELYLSMRGQYAFGNRLIPQAQFVAGGIYSVRGYPESVAAGDTAIIGTLEYRFHVPRLFGLEAEPGRLFGDTFRFAPQYVYGVPDWDLILKAFVDAGYVIVSDPLPFESDEPLIGAGIGLELVLKRNLNLRADWGFALEPIEAAGVHGGSNRVHIVLTLLF